MKSSAAWRWSGRGEQLRVGELGAVEAAARSRARPRPRRVQGRRRGRARRDPSSPGEAPKFARCPATPSRARWRGRSAPARAGRARDRRRPRRRAAARAPSRRSRRSRRAPSRRAESTSGSGSRVSSCAALADQLAVLDPDLAVGAVLLEEGRAEAAAGVAQGDLVRRLARRRDHGLGHLVERDARLGEERGQRLEPLPGAQPALRAPGRQLGLLAGDLVPGEVAAVVDGRDQPAPLRHLARARPGRRRRAAR